MGVAARGRGDTRPPAWRRDPLVTARERSLARAQPLAELPLLRRGLACCLCLRALQIELLLRELLPHRVVHRTLAGEHVREIKGSRLVHLALTIELIGELVCLQYHPLDRVESRAGALVLVTLGLERQVRHLLHTSSPSHGAAHPTSG